MAKKDKDLFGFEEMEKAFARCKKKYSDHADAMLMALGQATNKKTKSLTPVLTKKLRKSWRLKKVKEYKGGKVKVVRVQSTAPHAHLIEGGHRVIRTGRVVGRAEGKKMLETAAGEASRRFKGEADKLLAKLVEEWEK